MPDDYQRIKFWIGSAPDAVAVDVRFWHLADITTTIIDVCFRG
jgi:hypothetical protein